MNQKPLAEIISLSGKVAIVTGGAMGIGKGIVYRFAEAGASVVVADLNEAVAKKTADEMTARGWKAAACACDVSNADQVTALVESAIESFGGIDILVNNAGIYPNIPVMQMTEKEFDRIVAVNLKSIYLCTRLVAEKMIAQGHGGKIINITSVDAIHPSMVGLATYDATKHGAWGFTKNVALELAPHKIWVNAIAPGGVATPGTGADKPRDPQVEAMIKPFLARIPMQRMGEADEIGKVALFLASDMSSYMTGSQIVVDGGVLLA